MKKYQLLLLILLLIVNKPLITKNPDDVHPASIENIRKPAHEKQTAKRPAPFTLASIKKIAKLENKKFNAAILNFTKAALYCFGGYIKGRYAIPPTLYSLEMSINPTTNFVWKSCLEYMYHDYIISNTLDYASEIKNTCHDFLVKKKHLIRDAEELTYFAVFCYGAKKPLKSFYSKLMSISKIS